MGSWLAVGRMGSEEVRRWAQLWVLESLPPPISIVNKERVTEYPDSSWLTIRGIQCVATEGRGERGVLSELGGQWVRGCGLEGGLEFA